MPSHAMDTFFGYQMLFDAGEERRWSTDKSEFNRVFMTSNDEQLKRT